MKPFFSVGKIHLFYRWWSSVLFILALSSDLILCRPLLLSRQAAQQPSQKGTEEFSVSEPFLILDAEEVDNQVLKEPRNEADMVESSITKDFKDFTR